MLKHALQRGRRRLIYIGGLGWLEEKAIDLMRAIIGISCGRTPVGGLVFAANFGLERVK
jgi:hypothetical protein